MFKAGSGEKAHHKAKVKWFATWTVQKQILFNWPTFLAVIDAPGKFFKETREQLREILSNKDACETLQLELALVFDSGECLVQLCYLEEGDGFLSPRVWPRIEATELKLTGVLARDGHAGFVAPNLCAKANELYGHLGPAKVGTVILETLNKGKRVLQKFRSLKDTVWKKQIQVLNIILYLFFFPVHVVWVLFTLCECTLSPLRTKRSPSIFVVCAGVEVLSSVRPRICRPDYHAKPPRRHHVSHQHQGAG